MTRTKRLLALGMAGLLITGMAALAQPPAPPLEPQISQANFSPSPFGMQRCPSCDGYVCTAECAPKKKTVYSSKCVPFCLPYFHACAEGCGACGVLVHKKVLIKKSVNSCETETKCVAKPCPAPVAGVPAKP